MAAPLAALIVSVAELAVTVALAYLAGVSLVKLRQAKDLEFNRLWVARVALVASSLLWILALVLQSPALFGKSGIAPLDGLEALCASAHVISEGIAEPMALLVPVFAYRFARRAVGQPSPPKVSGRILTWSLFAAIPLTIVHAALAVIGVAILAGTALGNLFSPFDASASSCSLPLVSTLVQAVVVVFVIVLLNVYSLNYSRIVINRRLIKRLHVSQMTLTILLPVAILARVGSAVAVPLMTPTLDVFFHIYFFISAGIAAFLIWSQCLQPVKASLESPLKILPVYATVTASTTPATTTAAAAVTSTPTSTSPAAAAAAATTTTATSTTTTATVTTTTATAAANTAATADIDLELGDDDDDSTAAGADDSAIELGDLSIAMSPAGAAQPAKPAASAAAAITLEQSDDDDEDWDLAIATAAQAKEEEKRAKETKQKADVDFGSSLSLSSLDMSGSDDEGPPAARRVPVVVDDDDEDVSSFGSDSMRSEKM